MENGVDDDVLDGLEMELVENGADVDDVVDCLEYGDGVDDNEVVDADGWSLLDEYGVA